MSFLSSSSSRNWPPSELLIDSLLLIRAALPASISWSRFSFQPIHHSHGLFSCIYHRKGDRRENWLVVVRLSSQEVVTVKRLGRRCQYFIRNNDDYLVCGTYNDGASGNPHPWILRVFVIKTRSWDDQGVQLDSLVEDIIGQTVCFEIFGDYIYAISSSTNTDAREDDWASYYYAVRLKLSSPRSDVESAPKYSLWRRHHGEGPIHDAWSTLQLAQEPSHGSLMIIEVRMEWLMGQYPPVRTCYKTDLIFPQRSPDKVQERGFWGFGTDTSRGKTSHVHCEGHSDLLPLPQEAALCPIRSYHQSCSAFIDIIRNDISGEEPNLGPTCIRSVSGGSSNRQLMANESTGKKKNVISSWPMLSTITRRHPVAQILSGQSSSGLMEGVMDDRSMVYGVRDASMDTNLLVFVSFDPTTRLHGLPHPDIATLRKLALGACSQDSPEGQQMRDDPVFEPNAAAIGSGSSHTPPESPTPASWVVKVSASYLDPLGGGPLGFNFSLAGSFPQIF